ncbi:hypothetical protein BSKO_06224 [Bryopsis sp. KO-2023]|nr:hypothetical protein BSKO_06224 [Bryopsis sp. KO-2023]
MACKRRATFLQFSLLFLCSSRVGRSISSDDQRRPLLELTSDGTVFNVRSVDDFKQALFLRRVTRIFLFQDVWITEPEWKDFVVPEIDREVVVAPHDSLLDEGVVPQLFTDGLLRRIKIVENGLLILRHIQAVDIGEPRVVDGETRLLAFFDIMPGREVHFHNTTWNVEPFCSSLGGLAGVASATMRRCIIPDCEIVVREETNTVFVERGRWNNAVIAGEETPQVSSMAGFVTVVRNAPVHSYTSIVLEKNLTFFDSFFPESGLHINHRKVRVEGVDGRSITLQDVLGPVFPILLLGHLEIFNTNFLMKTCDLSPWRRFIEDGDQREKTVKGVSDPAYGSEWQYVIPSAIIKAVPSPQTKTTLKNVTFFCNKCSPVSFTQYGAALVQANISHFRDFVPDNGSAMSDSFPIRYSAENANLVTRTGSASLNLQRIGLESYYDVYNSFAALDLENVTLTCGSFGSIQVEDEPEPSSEDKTAKHSDPALHGSSKNKSNAPTLGAFAWVVLIVEVVFYVLSYAHSSSM